MLRPRPPATKGQELSVYTEGETIHTSTDSFIEHKERCDVIEQGLPG